MNGVMGTTEVALGPSQSQIYRVYQVYQVFVDLMLYEEGDEG